MIEAQTLQLTTFDQSRDQGVDGAARPRIFDAQPGKIVDVEEATVVDVGKCDPPVGDTVILTLEQTMQCRHTGFVLAAISGKAASDDILRSVDCGKAPLQIRRLAV